MISTLVFFHSECLIMSKIFVELQINAYILYAGVFLFGTEYDIQAWINLSFWNENQFVMVGQCWFNPFFENLRALTYNSNI